MKKVRLKQPVVYSLYALSFFVILGLLYLVSPDTTTLDIQENIKYVSKSIFDREQPVVAVDQKIIKPFTDEKVAVLRSFYDYESEESTQEKSIIYYENTYMQSNGIAYGGVEKFDVIAVLDGVVTSIKEDELLGTVVEIKHDDNIYTLYESVSDVKVKENDTVSQGTVIASSGVSNLQKDLGSHLFFEVIKNNNTINPEKIYGKSLKDL